ncbi:anti-sigma factor [Salinibacterium sp.]|uniref:anti-sigma factor n=1 Tax=Salinibacterium sp. TaxID=1915057 RepID=UPI00286AFF75|nr:anti-sigma factor [Salinibacterium sp.]
MRHVDPDILALLALGEHVGSPNDRAHLRDCEACRAELDNLERTAVVGRSTFDAGELLEPPDRVWSRISDELALAEDAPLNLAQVTALESRRSLRARRPRRWIAAFAAAAALVLVLGGVGATWLALRPAPTTVLASAALDAFPGWTGSTGEAMVKQQPDGARVIQVSLDTPGDGNGYREVWLMSSDASDLVSLGVVRGTAGTFTVPDGLDLSRYDLVDISSEPYDGDPTHSGDSILRGQLS